jgi:hypothetical protein
MKKLGFEKFMSSKISNLARIVGAGETEGGSRSYDNDACGGINGVSYGSDTENDEGGTTFHDATVSYNPKC